MKEINPNPRFPMPMPTLDDTRPDPDDWTYVTPAEWHRLFIVRAEKMTGQYVHRTNDGLYYLWKMGSQEHPDSLNQPTIGEAVAAYLAEFEPQDRSTWNAMFTAPVRKRT